MEFGEQTHTDWWTDNVRPDKAGAGNAAPDAASTDDHADAESIDEPAGAAVPDGHHTFTQSAAGGTIDGAGQDTEL